ncbi:right-handed parallel beta-helix repeat-containing protein [Pelagibius marinus]|uniref:right-handed parallel beta-helix repeat-containing protein n=1 Tax=Pelagibius marinus TaxID=2762760 RepID=UPI001872CEFC|nr:right-handed parallel beta-helix repeat-containing protein [Pelagibius marinus]
MQINRRSALAAAAALLAGFGSRPGHGRGESLTATPSTYLDRAADLRAGDRLLLTTGTYRRSLILSDLHGAPGNPIVIQGPADRSARFLAQRGHNTVELRNVSHLELRNLTLDGGNTPGVDGVKAHALTHHVTLENLEIVDHANHQQTVAISTKAPAWGWVIRNCIIRHAGTGLYLGNSNGAAPFVHGLIERNLIVDTIGYGLQIKHQGERPEISDMPTQAGSTIIRQNIISKARQPQAGFQGPRPNLLVGHFPPLGAGIEDIYEIYGNLLYQNLVNEPLFQGEGNVAFHDNLLVNHHGDGLWIQPHHNRPRKIAVFHNTIVAKGTGIRIRGGDPDFRQIVTRNAVFSEQPIDGGEQWDNFAVGYAAAGSHLRAPFGDWRALDLRPQPGRLRTPASDSHLLAAYADAEMDFAGNPRDDTYLGAYAGSEVPRQTLLPIPSQL